MKTDSESQKTPSVKGPSLVLTQCLPTMTSKIFLQGTDRGASLIVTFLISASQAIQVSILEYNSNPPILPNSRGCCWLWGKIGVGGDLPLVRTARLLLRRPREAALSLRGVSDSPDDSGSFTSSLRSSIKAPVRNKTCINGSTGGIDLAGSNSQI